MDRVIRLLCTLVLLQIFGGCATSNPVRHEPPLAPNPPPNGHSVMPVTGEHFYYLTCDTSYYHERAQDLNSGVFGKPGPDGKPDDGGLGEAATVSYLYALMSSNAYEWQGAQWLIPGWTRTDRYEHRSGLTYDIYERDGSDPKELVIAFRGTNFTHIEDWRVNLSLPFFQPRQAREANDAIVRIRSENPKANLVATGHSLGGGLAFNASLRHDGITAYAFNSSPRGFFRVPLVGKSNKRVHVFEFGEILQPFSRGWLRIRMPRHNAWRYNYMDFNFRFGKKYVNEHNMYLLSRGLLLSAISNGSEHARQVFVANIPREYAISKDAKWCSPIYDGSPRKGRKAHALLLYKLGNYPTPGPWQGRLRGECVGFVFGCHFLLRNDGRKRFDRERFA
jgi:pimeloyl-ACP methyl ester carboxylesterase